MYTVPGQRKMVRDGMGPRIVYSKHGVKQKNWKTVARPRRGPLWNANTHLSTGVRVTRVGPPLHGKPQGGPPCITSTVLDMGVCLL